MLSMGLMIKIETDWGKRELQAFRFVEVRFQ